MRCNEVRWKAFCPITLLMSSVPSIFLLCSSRKSHGARHHCHAFYLRRLKVFTTKGRRALRGHGIVYHTSGKKCIPAENSVSQKVSFDYQTYFQLNSTTYIHRITFCLHATLPSIAWRNSQLSSELVCCWFFPCSRLTLENSAFANKRPRRRNHRNSTTSLCPNLLEYNSREALHVVCANNAIASVVLLSERLKKHLSCSLAERHDFLRILVLFPVILGAVFDRLQPKVPFDRSMRCAHCMTQANYNGKHHTFKRNDEGEHYFESRLRHACSSNGGQRPQQPYKSSWLPGRRSIILIDLHTARLLAASIALFCILWLCR